MAEPRLGPDELDRLEDALEGLEALEDLRDPSEVVSHRLADFQFILQASRDALPLEDVRPGVLDGVLSEARMSAPDIAAPAKEHAQAPSFWARIRQAWLVPGLAVAGSAALVLILVKPMLADDTKLEEAGAVAAKDTPTPARLADTKNPSVSEFAQEEDSIPENQAVAGQAKADGAPPPPPAAPAPTVTRGAIGQRQAPTEPVPDPEPEVEAEEISPDDDLREGNAPDAGPKTAASKQGWNAIEQGDSARDGGDCFSARNHYARALDDGNDSVRARAYVGMGLCKRADGNSAAADEYFDKARELDEDAVKFADTRSDDKSPKPSSRRPKKKASRKRKSAVDFDEAMSPFKD